MLKNKKTFYQRRPPKSPKGGLFENIVQKNVLILKTMFFFKPPLGVGGLFLIFLLIIPLSINAQSKKNTKKVTPDIAVVQADFDHVGKVLRSYSIPYKLINYGDLEDKNIFKKYRVIFFPSGMEKKIESNLIVTPVGKSVGTVEYKKRSKIIDSKIISKNIKDYIENGGFAYFSGYSYKLLDDTFDVFDYYYDFPYMGLEGRIVVDHTGDMWNYTSYNTSAMYMTFPGWIVVKSIDQGKILSSANVKTARGKKRAVVSSFFNRGDGAFLYCSYYSTIYSTFKRFNVYRIVGTDLLNRLYEKSNIWEQKVTGSVADAFHRGEAVRTYRFSKKKGDNYLYFVSGTETFQIDIYDGNMKLLQSRDSFDREQQFFIPAVKDDMYIVKVFPTTKKRWSRFAIIAVSGGKMFPYKTRFMIFFGILLLIVVGYFLVRIFRR